MFGMGFTEIILIAIVAIIALGPEKLPSAMIEIAKFLKKFKSNIQDAKSSLDNELNISELKEEAAKYKTQIENAKSTLNLKKNLDLDLDDIINDEKKTKDIQIDEKDERASLKEPKKKKIKEKNKQTKASEENLRDHSQADAINKFKVDFDGIEEEK